MCLSQTWMWFYSLFDEAPDRAGKIQTKMLATNSVVRWIEAILRTLCRAGVNFKNSSQRTFKLFISQVFVYYVYLILFVWCYDNIQIFWTFCKLIGGCHSSPIFLLIGSAFLPNLQSSDPEKISSMRDKFWFQKSHRFVHTNCEWTIHEMSKKRST